MESTQPSCGELVEENAILGAIIDDIQKRVPSTTVRQTEEALLEMHTECVRTKDALAAEQRELQRARILLVDARRAAVLLQQRARMHELHAKATVQALIAEVHGTESEYAMHAAYAHSLVEQVGRLKEAASEAVRGMQEAQTECGWLHQQMQQLLKEVRPPQAPPRAPPKHASRFESRAACPQPTRELDANPPQSDAHLSSRLPARAKGSSAAGSCGTSLRDSLSRPAPSAPGVALDGMQRQV